MKKISLLLITIVFLFPTHLKAQNKGDTALGIAGGLMAIGAGIAAVEQMKESAELTATQWVLTNLPDKTSFSLNSNFLFSSLRYSLCQEALTLAFTNLPVFSTNVLHHFND